MEAKKPRFRERCKVCSLRRISFPSLLHQYLDLSLLGCICGLPAPACPSPRTCFNEPPLRSFSFPFIPIRPLPFNTHLHLHLSDSIHHHHASFPSLPFNTHLHLRPFNGIHHHHASFPSLPIRTHLYLCLFDGIHRLWPPTLLRQVQGRAAMLVLDGHVSVGAQQQVDAVQAAIRAGKVERGEAVVVAGVWLRVMG